MSSRRGFSEWFTALADSDLPQPEYLVALALARHVNWTTATVRIGTARLMEFARLPRRSVQKAIGELERRRLITFDRRGGGGPKCVHTIRLHMDAVTPRNSAPRAQSSVSNSAPGAQFGTNCAESGGSTAPNATANCAPGAPIHHPYHHPGSPSWSSPSRNGSALTADGMDGNAKPATVAEALALFKVRGPNADALAQTPGLTIAEVVAEGTDVAADKDARNKGAVLAQRLMARHGVKPASRTRVNWNDPSTFSLRCRAERPALAAVQRARETATGPPDE